MDSQELKNLIKEALRDKELTQTELAELIGSHPSNLTRALNRNIVDERSLWLKILETLGLEVVVRSKTRPPESPILLSYFLRMELQNRPVYDLRLVEDFGIKLEEASNIITNLFDKELIASYTTKAKPPRGHPYEITAWKLTPKGKELAKVTADLDGETIKRRRGRPRKNGVLDIWTKSLKSLLPFIFVK